MKQALFVIALASCTAGLSVGPAPVRRGPPPPVAYVPAGDPSMEAGAPPPPMEPSRTVAAPSEDVGYATDARIPPGQWTLQEKEYWIKLQEEMDEYATRANEACGARISGRFVHESFRGKFTAGGNYGLDINTRALCGAMSRALVEVCNGGSTAKQAVASQVHQMVCEYGPARYGIRNGVFQSSINTQPATLDTHYNTMLGVIRKSL